MLGVVFRLWLCLKKKPNLYNCFLVMIMMLVSFVSCVRVSWMLTKPPRYSKIA